MRRVGNILLCEGSISFLVSHHHTWMSEGQSSVRCWLPAQGGSCCLGGSQNHGGVPQRRDACQRPAPNHAQLVRVPSLL